MSKKQKKEKQKKSTKDFIGIQEITNHSLNTRYGNLIFFIVKPVNLSVLSESSVGAKIYGLMTVLKGLAEIEMLCLNSKENFDMNKQYLKERLANESNPVIRKLLSLDSTNLDRMQVTMATAREFLLIIRLRDEKESEVIPYLSRVEKSMKDAGFHVKRAEEQDLKRILSVYFEQNVTTERYEEFDGERWIL